MKKYEDFTKAVLTGSEKQIAWAESIRKGLYEKYITSCDRYEEDILTHLLYDDEDIKADEAMDIAHFQKKYGFSSQGYAPKSLLEECIEKLFEKLFVEHTDAAWWIDHRSSMTIYHLYK